MVGVFKPAVQQNRPSLQQKPAVQQNMPHGNGVSFAAQQNFSSKQMRVQSPLQQQRIFSRLKES
jgi:hypothetical protein